jgi:hypothetical protein
MSAHRYLPALLTTLGTLAAAASTPALAQSATILDASGATAIVETIDMRDRAVLLRGETGNLVTVHVPREARNLPQLRPGDRVAINVVNTVAARIARPGDPLPESTVTAARSAAGERPGGLFVEHRRMRVKIEGVDAASNTVAFIGEDRVPRRVTLQDPAMRAMLPSLKVGDEVDVTFTEAVSLRAMPASH